MRLTCVAVMIGLLALGGAPAIAKTRVLCITDVAQAAEPNYYQTVAASLYIQDYYFSPAKILSDEFEVVQVPWIDAAASLSDLSSYRAVILWDAPLRIEDDRDNDPHYRNLAVLSDAADRIAKWVNDGGALITAGGVTSYGDGHADLGVYRANKTRRYIGWGKSVLAHVLPVEIPEGVSLTPWGKRTLVAHDSPITRGLNFADWNAQAFHKLVAKPNATVDLAASEGEPLIARWASGKGKVVTVALAPRANLLVVRGKDLREVPINWSGEAVLWERALRWSLDLPALDDAKEASLRQAYASRIADPKPIPRAWKLSEFPYGTHVLQQALPKQSEELWLQYFHDGGFDFFVTQNGSFTNGAYAKARAELMDRKNLYGFVHTDFAHALRKQKAKPEDYAQVVMPSGKFALHYGDPSPDPHCPAVVEAAADEMKHLAQTIAPYPSIRGVVFEDEWAWVAAYRNPYEKSQGVGSFSPFANALYKEKTGRDVPKVVYREPGYVAPENDDFLQWCLTVRADAFANYNRAVSDAAKPFRSDLLLTNYPGGFEGNLDVMLEEFYLDCWKESELEALERIDARANYREDGDRTKHPVWGLLGIFRMPEDKSIYPESLRLIAGVGLGGGAKGLILWNAANLWTPNMQHPGRDSLEVEARRLGDYLDRFGPMLLNLKKTRSDVWITTSWMWLNSYDAYLHIPPEGKDAHPEPETPWRLFQVNDIAGPAVMRAGMYSEFVTEKQLMSDELMKRKVLLLPGLTYCRQGAVDNIEKFIKQGGKVFVDQSAKVKIEGATVLPIDFAEWHRMISAGERPIVSPTEAVYRRHRAMREGLINRAIGALDPVLKAANPNVTIDSTEAAHTFLEHGQTKYLFVYNTNTDRGQTLHVTLRDLPSVIIDIETSQQVTATPELKGEVGVDLTLPAGGWKVLALTPAAPQRVTLRASAQAQALQMSVSVIAGDKPISASVPIEITLKTARGDVTLWRATSEGTLQLDLPLTPDMLPVSAVRVKELFGGQSVDQKLN